MQIVIADTGPIRYLMLLNQIDILPKLFESVFIPSAVYEELRQSAAPSQVRAWLAAPPDWLKIKSAAATADPAFLKLDEGERAALELGLDLEADLILMDERKGTAIARAKGFEVIGTLGILSLATHHGLIDFAEAIIKLRNTNFRGPKAIIDALLERHRK